jgi:hypothetical protein
VNKQTSPAIDIDEIVSHAAINADTWLEQAIKQVDYYMGDGAAEENPLTAAAFMVACAISYQADRQVDAAEIIARAVVEAAGKGVDHG